MQEKVTIPNVSRQPKWPRVIVVLVLTLLFYWINDDLLGGVIQYYLGDLVRLLFSGFEGIFFGVALFLPSLAGLAYIASTKVSHPILFALLLVSLAVCLCGLDYTVVILLLEIRIDRDFDILISIFLIVVKATPLTFLALRSFQIRQLRVVDSTLAEAGS